VSEFSNLVIPEFRGFARNVRDPGSKKPGELGNSVIPADDLTFQTYKEIT
jgi:hypothetical protein